jgi:hypothetical protein
MLRDGRSASQRDCKTRSPGRLLFPSISSASTPAESSSLSAVLKQPRQRLVFPRPRICRLQHWLIDSAVRIPSTSRANGNRSRTLRPVSRCYSPGYIRIELKSAFIPA